MRPKREFILSSKESLGRVVGLVAVGAGFSAAAELPGWVELLQAALRLVPGGHPNRHAIESTLLGAAPSSRELEAAVEERARLPLDVEVQYAEGAGI